MWGDYKVHSLSHVWLGGGSTFVGAYKACENQWYDTKVTFASIFLCLFHLDYLKEYVYKNIIHIARISREIQKILYEKLI